jgi:hypothetical protein
MTMLLVLLAALIGVIVLQGTITMLAAWGITGRRPGLGAVIKALLLSGISYCIAAVLMTFQAQHLGKMGLPLPLVMLIVVMVPLLISCWVFANCLDINLLQAFAINLLVGAIYIMLALASTPYVPQIRSSLPPTQFTQAAKPAQEGTHV